MIPLNFEKMLIKKLTNKSAHYTSLKTIIEVLTDDSYFLLCEMAEAGTISVPEEHRQEYAWLQETEKVEGSLIYGKEYTGPKIVTE